MGINCIVGWNVFVGYLVESGCFLVMGCDVFKVVSDYFGGSCVLGVGEICYFEFFCCFCRGDSFGEGVCDKSFLERYYDYSGVFWCLVEGVGDVVFVKYSMVLENMDGKIFFFWGQVLLLQDFELLCWDGSWVDVIEWRQCYLVCVFVYVVVVWVDIDGGFIFWLFNEGQCLFSYEGSSFQMFSFEVYGQKDLFFKDFILEFVFIVMQIYEVWLGQEYLYVMKGLFCDFNWLFFYLCWCVFFIFEIQKCGDMVVVFGWQWFKLEIQCVLVKFFQYCMEQIQVG